MTTTILLGPQRFLTTAGTVVRGLGTEGPVATVTAGWEDRESDDAELQDVMHGRGRNLRLYGRMMEVLTADPAFAAAALAHRDAMDDLARVYSTRLGHALDAVYAVHRRRGRQDIVTAAVDDCIRTVRDIDVWYLVALAQLYGDPDLTAAVESSDLVARHRAEVAEILSGCSVLAVAGGHVANLLRALRLLAVRPPADLPVVAWSGGAMAMTDRVVLFHDETRQGFAGVEIWDRGLGRAPGIVALPHARRRLHLEDRVRVMVLARRFPDATCVLLDDGFRVSLRPDGSLPPGARILTADGTIGTVEETT